MLPVRRAQEHFSLSAASLPLVTSTRDTGVATALSNTALETNRAAMKQSFIKLLLKEKQLSTMGHQGTARTWRKELSSVFPGKCSCSSFRPSRGPCERHPASCVCVCVCVRALFLSSTVCSSRLRGISQARILKCLPFPLPGDLPDPGIKFCLSCIGRWALYQ